MHDPIPNRLDLEGATERINPAETPVGILSIHLKRYQFALSLCEGKTVLDAACGVGYGSAYLAPVASHVIGLDIDPIAIEYAQNHYENNQLNFEIADVSQTKITDSQFDTICSFETIEHLSDIPAYLQEMTRLLKPDGVYIVSTPQVAKTDRNPCNPYHTIEFSRHDFEALLLQYFNRI